MPRGLTWPNDPETYFSNARAYRIVFGPGYFISAKAGGPAPTPVPITPSEPVGLCSDLPPQYGFDANNANCAGEIDKGAVFAGAALAPKCSTLLDPACKVGDTQYDCYLPLGRCATWQCSLTGLGGPAHAEPPGLINVLCRWPAASPSPTPTAVGTGLPTPTATPIATPGATVTSAPVSKVGALGATVAAGTFTVQNNLEVTESIGAATIHVSHPSLFSAMTLSGGGQSSTVTPPNSSTTFTFATPLLVPAGGSATFSLSAVISTQLVMLDGELNYADVTLVTYLPITRSAWPLTAGLSILGIALLGLPKGTRRRVIIIAVLALGIATASAGCNGSSNNPSPVASAQRVTAVAITTADSALVTVGGLPAALGIITR